LSKDQDSEGREAVVKESKVAEESWESKLEESSGAERVEGWSVMSVVG